MQRLNTRHQPAYLLHLFTEWESHVRYVPLWAAGDVRLRDVFWDKRYDGSPGAHQRSNLGRLGVDFSGAGEEHPVGAIRRAAELPDDAPDERELHRGGVHRCRSGLQSGDAFRCRTVQKYLRWK